MGSVADRCESDTVNTRNERLLVCIISCVAIAIAAFAIAANSRPRLMPQSLGLQSTLFYALLLLSTVSAAICMVLVCLRKWLFVIPLAAALVATFRLINLFQ